MLAYLRAQQEFGLPLQIYNSDSLFIPLMSLPEVDIFDRCKGILAGTTNPLFLNFPKARADVVINLDNEKIEFNEKSTMVKLCRQHTTHEKKMLT